MEQHVKKNKFSFFAVITGIVVIVTFFLVTIFLVYPLFTRFYLQHVERGAVKTGNHIARAYFKEGISLEKEGVPASLIEKISSMKRDYHLEKVKVFDFSGKIRRYLKIHQSSSDYKHAWPG